MYKIWTARFSTASCVGREHHLVFVRMGENRVISIPRPRNEEAGSNLDCAHYEPVCYPCLQAYTLPRYTYYVVMVTHIEYYYYYSVYNIKGLRVVRLLLVAA